MRSLIAMIAIVLAIALGSPTDRRSSILSTRNNTMVTASSPVLFKFGPSIINAMCSDVYATRISVQYTSDDFTLNDDCRAFLDLMGGLKAQTDVDVLFVCQGTKTKGTGDDENKLKMMFFVTSDVLVDGKSKDSQWIAALLQATSIPKDKVVAVPASVDVDFSDEDGFTVNQFTC